MESLENNTEQTIRHHLDEGLQKIGRRDPSALNDIELALEQSRAGGHAKLIGLAMIAMSNYYSLIRGDFETSMDWCIKAEAHFDFSDDREAFQYYSSLGLNYHFLYKLPEAQEAYLNAIYHMDKVHERSSQETNRLASIYYNLYILFSYSEWSMAEKKNLETALSLYESVHNNSGIINCYGALINDLEKKGQYKEALEYAHKRLQLGEQTNDELQIFGTCSSMSVLYARLKQGDAAHMYHRRAAEIMSKYDVKQFQASFYDEKGQMLLELGDSEGAVQAFYEAEKIYAQLNENVDLSKLYRLKSEAYEKTGQMAEALDYQKRYAHSLKDNFKLDKMLSISATRNEFERLNQERETAILKQKSDEINMYVRQLEQSNEELKQFAHAASHDLREPVRMIVSYAELLEMSLRNQITSEQREFLDYLKEGGRRVNEMIKGILTFSRLNSHVDESNIDLRDVMQMVRENLKLAILEKSAVIEYPELPVVRGNSVLLTQLFQNLIQNGIKYNNDNAPKVVIGCEEMDMYYKFTVSDNGLGIEDKFRLRVFDMFTRLHNRMEYSGSGIGLAICKKIVERSGGKITNQSNAEGGSDFIFTLPKPRS